jgi:hypothetical protein
MVILRPEKSDFRSIRRPLLPAESTIPSVVPVRITAKEDLSLNFQLGRQPLRMLKLYGFEDGSSVVTKPVKAVDPS